MFPVISWKINNYIVGSCLRNWTKCNTCIRGWRIGRAGKCLSILISLFLYKLSVLAISLHVFWQIFMITLEKIGVLGERYKRGVDGITHAMVKYPNNPKTKELNEKLLKTFLTRGKHI